MEHYEGHNREPWGERLRYYITNIEELEGEKAGIAAKIREIYSDARIDGFDPKAMCRIIQLRRLSADERARQQALVESYLGIMGQLDGQPMGDYARKKLDEELRKMRGDQEPQDERQDGEHLPPKPEPEPPPPPPPEETPEQAFARGQEDAKAGKSLVDNPYRSRDPRRAKWDEGYCRQIGSDGMDIPESLRRKTPKKKKKDSEGNGEDKK